MLDKRAKRIVWSFLIGVTAVEGGFTYTSFQHKGDVPAAIGHYTFAHAAPLHVWIGAALIAALYAGYCATASATIRTFMLAPSAWRPVAAIRAFAIVMALVTGFFEEAVFRQTLMDVLHHRGIADGMQIAFSALAFGAVHAVWGMFGGNWRAAFYAMLSTGALGAALAALYIAGGRAIAPCIAAHIAINLLIEPWLIITAATNGWSRTSVQTV